MLQRCNTWLPEVLQRGPWWRGRRGQRLKRLEWPERQTERLGCLGTSARGAGGREGRIKEAAVGVQRDEEPAAAPLVDAAAAVLEDGGVGADRTNGGDWY